MEIRPVDMKEQQNQEAVAALVNQAFGFEVEGKSILLNTQSPGNPGTLWLGAYKGDLLVGFNAFIAHQFFLGADPYLMHQSCWSAVSPQHRKQKIFFHLIQHAKQSLRQQGSQGIIGFPNGKSNRIFLGPLKFQDRGLFARTLLPPFFFSRKLAQQFPAFPLERLDQNNAQLVELKRQLLQDQLIEEGEPTRNYLWGKFTTIRKKGIPLKVFVIGGIQYQDPASFLDFLARFCRRNRPAFISFLYHPTSRYHALFHQRNVSETTGNLIFFPLQPAAEHIGHFDFMAGVMDTF